MEIRKNTINNFMFLSYLTLVVALTLSTIAAWYSILGLIAIFAAAVVPIVIMGTALEVAKITVTVWLHEYWTRSRFIMKCYLVPAVVMLMIITSMGIFGFLSKAHMDQSLVSGDVQSKIAIYDEKIKIAKENIDANRKALKQMDEAVDQVMGRSSSETGADKAVALRRSQQKERGRLLAEIQAEQKTVSILAEERAPIAAEVRKVEAEVGPIKYIAALIYGDNPDNNLLESAVRWVIIILVIVFDPLAIMMVLASTESLKWERDSRRKPDYEPDDGPLTDEQIEQIKETVKQSNDSSQILSPDPSPPGWMYNTTTTTYPSTEEEVEELSNEFDRSKHAYLDKPFVHFENLKLMVHHPDDAHDEESDNVKLAIKQWKYEHPNDTIKNQRRLLEYGLISQLPWLTSDKADNALPETTADTSFGSVFPDRPVKGQMFLNIDTYPNRLHKFNGSRWIEVDKSLSDLYTYDEAYMDYLIAKIASGEYDAELLTSNEQEQLAIRLKQTKS